MKPRKRILYIDSTRAFGGAITSLANFLWELNDSLFEPLVIAGGHFNFWEHPHKKIPVLVVTPIQVIEKPFIQKIIHGGGKRFGVMVRKTLSLFFYFLDFMGSILPYSFCIYRKIRGQPVDLIHLNNYVYKNAGGILLAKMIGKKCIVHHRGFEFISPVARAWARYVDHHIAISQSIKTNIMNLGVPENRITIIPEGIDLKEYSRDKDIGYLRREFDIKDDQPLFGIVGWFVEWKGHPFFLRAAQRVFREFPKARAFLIGSGPETYENQLKKFSEEIGIHDNVIFTGYRRDIAAFMALLDVVVHASIKPEPFGRVIIEGMAIGKPVIATNIGAPQEIIRDGINGYLVPPGDPQAMADRIIELLKNRQNREWIGMEAIKTVKNKYTIEIHSRKIEQIYLQLLKKD